MRIEYLAAIAIAAFTGLAVHSVGSLPPPEKQSMPAPAQLANLLAASVFASVRWLTARATQSELAAPRKITGS
jgi:hypothetical protein